MKFAHDIIRKPIISERSMETTFDKNGNEIKKYTFEVATCANKVEIKKAVEVAFGKKVASVRTANYDGKLKRQRRSDAGRTAHWKKAYVKLANGETLDLV